MRATVIVYLLLLFEKLTHAPTLSSIMTLLIKKSSKNKTVAAVKATEIPVDETSETTTVAATTTKKKALLKFPPVTELAVDNRTEFHARDATCACEAPASLAQSEPPSTSVLVQKRKI